MPLPPPQDPKTQPPSQAKPQGGDGQVAAYERVVNGKVVKVNAYSNQSTISTSAAAKARLIPGRPRMMAKPGSYSGGRDLPGLMASAKTRNAGPPQ